MGERVNLPHYDLVVLASLMLSLMLWSAWFGWMIRGLLFYRGEHTDS
jgi:hypothetical protein